MKIDTGPISKVSLIQIHPSFFKTNVSLDYAFPFYSTLCCHERKQEIDTLTFNKNWKIIGIVLNIFSLSEYAVFISSLLVLGVESILISSIALRNLLSLYLEQLTPQNEDTGLSHQCLICQIIQMLVSSPLNVTMGNGFMNAIQIKENRTKQYCMNSHRCGHVYFIHVLSRFRA